MSETDGVGGKPDQPAVDRKERLELAGLVERKVVLDPDDWYQFIELQNKLLRKRELHEFQTKMESIKNENQ